jgi:L-malate glycosyltransferase
MLGRHTGRVPNPAEELAVHLPSDEYCCRLASSQPNRYLRLLDILWSILRQRRHTDILSLQVYSGLSFIVEDAASWLARRLGMRIVMVLHGGAMPDFLAAHPGWVGRVLRRADRLVSPSHYLAGALGAGGYEVAVIPNGIDIRRYPSRLRCVESPRLVWLRAFHAVYQPEMAIRVVQRLIPRFPQISLQMIGPRYGLESLEASKQLIDQMGLKDHVQIVGYVPKPDLPAWLDQGEVFLNTTRFESFGITVMEAAACGLPVITTNVGELPFIWKQAQNALLVAPDDVDGMAGAVKHLFTDRELAERLSRASRRTAEQFDWSNVLPQWEKLFAEILDN